MTELTFSLATARALHLAAQGLLQPRRRKAQKADVLDDIRCMGVLQIDTINVIARSPYMTLFSRLGAYRNEWLDELLDEGVIAECWAHEACFVPASEYRYHRDYRAGRAGHGVGNQAPLDGFDAPTQDVHRQPRRESAAWKEFVARPAVWESTLDEVAARRPMVKGSRRQPGLSNCICTTPTDRSSKAASQ